MKIMLAKDNDDDDNDDVDHWDVLINQPSEQDVCIMLRLNMNGNTLTYSFDPIHHQLSSSIKQVNRIHLNK